MLVTPTFLPLSGGLGSPPGIQTTAPEDSAAQGTKEKPWWGVEGTAAKAIEHTRRARTQGAAKHGGVIGIIDDAPFHPQRLGLVETDLGDQTFDQHLRAANMGFQEQLEVNGTCCIIQQLLLEPQYPVSR